MPRLLDIVIPHYNEEWKIVKPALDILYAQKGIDFNKIKVWFIEDGESEYNIQKETLEPYFFLEQVILQHKGVSHCRNWGIDNADATWICFCDCDDCYTSIMALYNILYILGSESSNSCDLMWNAFYMVGLKSIAMNEEFNPVFIHNKYYRLSFLKDHHIRFNEKLYMSEDSAFNMLVRMELGGNRIGRINTQMPMYAWCRRLGSITMDASKWIFNTEGHFDRNLYVLSEYRKRKCPGEDAMVARIITDAYSMLTKEGIEGDKSGIIKRVADFYQENKEIFDQTGIETIEMVLKASDTDAGISYNNKIARPKLEDWIKENLE